MDSNSFGIYVPHLFCYKVECKEGQNFKGFKDTRRVRWIYIIIQRGLTCLCVDNRLIFYLDLQFVKWS